MPFQNELTGYKAVPACDDLTVIRGQLGGGQVPIKDRGMTPQKIGACAKFSVNTEEMWYNRERAQEGREKWEDQGNPRR